MNESFRITWRIPEKVWTDDQVFKSLMKAVLYKKDTSDELALVIAEPSNSAYDELDRVQKIADLFVARSKEIRRAGKTVGWNLWPSFGAGEQEVVSPYRPENPFPRMVGMNGEEDPSLVCPVSDSFLAYSRNKFTILAKAAPDFLWIDDDARFTHLGGVPYPCFCEKCVKGFQNGIWKSRQELVDALQDPRREDLRIAWSAYNADRLAFYCAQMREAVDQVDPSIDIGLMTVSYQHTTYSGDYIEKCMKALRSSRGRPGDGFYTDDMPSGAFRKCFQAGWQNLAYPETTAKSYYEEDSYPRVFLDKSLTVRRNEVNFALMAGCTGVAYNHIKGNPRLDDLLHDEMDLIHTYRPLWEGFTSYAYGLPWAGFAPAFHEFMMAHMDCQDGWFREQEDKAYDMTPPLRLARVGLPLTADFSHGFAKVFSGRTIRAFSKEQLKEIFSHPVLMDAEALKELDRMGLACYAGVRPGASHRNTTEVLTDHPLNGPFAGFSRYASSLEGTDLEPLSAKTASLAFSRDNYGIPFGSCLSLYENELGGKVAVFGYSPWTSLEDPHKFFQLRRLAEWMGSPLTLRWDNDMEVSQLYPLIRTDGNRAAVMLCNGSADVSYPVIVRLTGTMKQAFFLKPDGTRQRLEAEAGEDTLLIRVPSLGSFDMAVLLAEP